ncbi:neprilysin-2 [Dermacentor silvarum]|uniref:neprilysin-2 n=1 Tax=Dermacentor silvarum TaxID=543639 RepID=UPI001898E674|nr:neprilysin-2 [Dermacentor silvarum]
MTGCSQGESPITPPQVPMQSNVEDFSMCAFPDDDVKHVQTTSQTTGRIRDTIKTTSQMTPRCPSFAAKNITAIAFAVVTMFTLAFMLLAALLAPSRSRGTAVSGLCSTEDCVMHSRLIHHRTNASVDPCKDFQAFACSAWPASKKIVSFASGTTWDALVAWYKGFENLLTMSSERYLPAQKALAMYQACMEGKPAGQERHTGMEALKKFMRQRRIHWPGEPDLNAHPLGVLLDFAFNWQTHFWFHVQVLQGNRGQRNTLVLRLGNFITFWSNYHESLVADQVYYDYLINYFEAFADAGDRRPTREEVARMESLHSDVLNRFVELQTRNKKSPAEFPLSEIELYTPNITTSVWVTKLCEHVAVWPEFQDGDQVVVEDTALLESVNEFFVKYGRAEILRHIAWFFVQVFAPLGDINLLKNKFGDQDKGVENRPVFCATEVEATYGVLLTSVYVARHLTLQVRMQVNRTLTYIINAAVNGINRLSWGNDSSRMAIIEKLKNTGVSLWPPDTLLTWRGLNEMYATFAPHKDSFAEYWVHGHERLRQLAEQPRYGQALAIRPNFMLPLLAYDYVLNTVSIAATTLARPLFYAQGTAAVDHGGLGFGFARELVKALNSAGLKVDPAGRINDSWVTSHWREQTSMKANCLSSGKDIFPEVPALQLAYEAFRRQRQESPASLRLSGVWSEDQVFFITACFSMCTRNGQVRALTGDCNKAVSNFPAFAQAFRCPSGSPMNPEQKCRYFD